MMIRLFSFFQYNLSYFIFVGILILPSLQAKTCHLLETR